LKRKHPKLSEELASNQEARKRIKHTDIFEILADAFPKHDWTEGTFIL